MWNRLQDICDKAQLGLSSVAQKRKRRSARSRTTKRKRLARGLEPLEQRTMLAGDTIGMYAPGTSLFQLKESFGSGAPDQYAVFGPGQNSGWTPLTGDWDGDGVDTVGLYQPDLSIFHLKDSNEAGASDHYFGFGPGGAGWIPLTGDWDGDGVDTVGLYQPDLSLFHLKNSFGSGASDIYFGFGPGGNAGWTPLVGDWNGDGTDTIGLYQPDVSLFHLKDSFTPGASDQYFAFGPGGSAGWQPLTGDWDGDGTDTIGLYQPDLSVYHLKDTFAAGPSDHYFAFGPSATGWTPLIGDWDGTNRSPVAANDSLTTDEDTQITGASVLSYNGTGFDYDPDPNDNLMVTKINGLSFTSGATFALAMGTLLSMNANGDFTYDPNGQFENLAAGQTATDTFTYTIDDGQGETNSAATATVVITIVGRDEGVNEPLIAPSSSWDGTTEWDERTTPTDPARTTFKPVAHFAIPPYQDVTEDFTIPVMAFAKGGIEKVTFTVEGNTIDVMAPSIVTEYDGRPFEAYVATLDASTFPAVDGAFEVYATAHPTDPTARERVIKLPMFANIQGTLPKVEVFVDDNNGSDTTGDGSSSNQFATIVKAKEELRLSGQISGGEIVLRNGNYVFSESQPSQDVSNARWLTIRPDDGHAPKITDSGNDSRGLRVRRLKVTGVNLATSLQTKDATFEPESVWLDNLSYTGPGQTKPSRAITGWDEQYFTDFTASDARDGIQNGTMARNVSLHRLGSDAISQTKAAINVDVVSLDNSGTDFHPDIWQVNGTPENNMLYGVLVGTEVVSAQGVFLSAFAGVANDVAVINSAIRGGNNQFNGISVSHVLLHGNTFEDNFLFRDTVPATVTYEYLDIRGNVFGASVNKPSVANHGLNNNDWDSNFFVNSGSIEGTNSISGTPDWNTVTFEPIPGGNLQSVSGGLTVLDANGNERSAVDAYFGAFEAL